MDIIVGQKSRLSKALNYMHPSSVVVSGRDPIECQWIKDAKNIFICAAITNPVSDAIQIEKVNVDLPLWIAQQNIKANIITFGTTLENRIEISNRYVDSKRNLLSRLKQLENPFIHFQLNTLYGICEPKKHMFLYDLYKSISSCSTLKMSSGYQLREYHHYFDVVSIVLEEIRQSSQGVIDISNGNPISLRELATGVCENLNSNIHIEFDTKKKEKEIFSKNKVKYSPHFFREPVLGITNYLRGII